MNHYRFYFDLRLPDGRVEFCHLDRWATSATVALLLLETAPLPGVIEGEIGYDLIGPKMRMEIPLENWESGKDETVKPPADSALALA
jgi:hypothetical protein